MPAHQYSNKLRADQLEFHCQCLYNTIQNIPRSVLRLRVSSLRIKVAEVWEWKLIRTSVLIDWLHWVRDLMAPMHLGLTDGPFLPHVEITGAL
jgi:hypothetical protein